MTLPDNIRPTEEELAYIKYSAKELLFHQGQKLESLANAVNEIRLTVNGLQFNTVTRAELSNTRRWAVGAVIASAGTLAAVLRLLGV